MFDDGRLVRTQTIQNAVDDIEIINVAGNDVTVTKFESFLLTTGTKNALCRQQKSCLVVRVGNLGLALQVTENLRQVQIFLPNLAQQGRPNVDRFGKTVVGRPLANRLEPTNAALCRIFKI